VGNGITVLNEFWSNKACKGYCIAAMQGAGYSREQIREVLEEMTALFEDMSVEEAKEVRNI